MVKLAGLIIRLLRIINANEKLSLGYVYEGMIEIKLVMKNWFMGKKRLYKPYTVIIKE